jgi:hypothetical protein
MPYRTDTVRVEKYGLAVIPDNVRAKFAALLPFMIVQQQSLQAQIVVFEMRVRALLDTAGIAGTLRINYLNLGRALFKHMGSQSGIALRKTATAEKAKFVAYGCDSTLCDSIINAVIGAAAY